MTRVSTLILAASLPLLAFGARAADDAAQLGPQELVTKVAQDTLRDLDAHRSEYKQNPKRVRELVDKNMLPHFDTAYAAQLVLAKNWRTATPEQRKRFVEAFYQSLLQNYGDALLEFTPDRLKILPFQGKPDDTVATVRSEVRRDNGQRVPVNYSLRKTADGWKAYDVQIEGVSYVKSFRTDFGSEIQQRGLDPVIQRLEQQVASGTVQKPTAKPDPTSKRRPRRSSERDGRKPGPARIARRRALSRQRRARRVDSWRSAGAERVALRAVQGPRHRPGRRRRERQRRTRAADRVAAPGAPVGQDDPLRQRAGADRSAGADQRSRRSDRRRRAEGSEQDASKESG